MEKVNKILIRTTFRDLEEICEVCGEMLKCFKNNDILPTACKERSITNMDITNKILKIDSDSEKYKKLLEMIVEELYNVINLAVLFLENFVSKRKSFRSKSISLGVITQIFWKRLKEWSGGGNVDLNSNMESFRSSYINLSEILEENKQCEVCNYTNEKIKSLMTRFEESSEEMNLESNVKLNKSMMKENIQKILQTEAIESCFSAILSDVRLYSNKYLSVVKENAVLKDHIIKLENVEKDINEKYQKLDESYKKIMKKEKDLTENVRELRETELNLKEKNLQYYNKVLDIEKLLDSTNKKHEIEIKNINNSYEQKINDINQHKNHQIEQLITNKKIWEQIYDINEQTIHELSKNNFNQNFILADLHNDIDICVGQFQNTFQHKLSNISEINSSLKNEIEQVFLDLDQYKTKCETYEEIMKCATDKSTNVESPNKSKKNPLLDMEEQIQRNESKITELQEQNEKLRKTVNKIKALQFIKKTF